MCRAGLLTDVPPFNLWLGLTVRPAVIAGGGIAAPGAGWRGHYHARLDATQRIGANTLKPHPYGSG